MAGEVQSYRDLKVWQKGMDLAAACYLETKSLPVDERFGLVSQIRRAAVSVPANIAEGAARHSGKEFKYFLSNAQGSISELATELLIAQKLGYVNRRTFDLGNDELTSIGRMILGLSRSVNRGSS